MSVNIVSLAPCNEPLQVETPDGTFRILSFALVQQQLVNRTVIGCMYLHNGELKINLGGKIGDYEWRAEIPS